MMVVVWIFAVVGFIVSVIVVGGLILEPSPDRRQSQAVYQARPYHPAQVHPVISVPLEDETERAIQEHQTALEQYRAMLDELYDYGDEHF